MLTQPGSSARLDEVGTLVGLSPARAQRAFSRTLGDSPAQFHQTVRLEVGAILLLSSDRRVIDIAFQTGFDSHEGFTRAFRRRFGESPSNYRRRRPHRPNADLGGAIAIARCLRLHHRPLTRKERPMSHDVTIEELAPIPVLFQHRRVDRDALGEMLAEVLPAVFAYVMEAGLAPAGHPFVRYLGESPAFVDIDAGIPLVEAPATSPPDGSGIAVGELPAGRAAVTTHVGPYEGLGDAHAAVERWIAESGHEATGDRWEMYLTDPGEVSDPAQWQTKVCWSIG